MVSSQLEKILTLRGLVIAAAFVLGAFGVHNAWIAVFSQGEYEVIYNYDETVRDCIQNHCFLSAQLAIANTGQEVQESVVVKITDVPGGIRGSATVLNLSATEPRTGDPGIHSDHEHGVATYRLDHFTPGALVLIKFSGIYPADRDIKREPQVEIKAKGRIIEGDPRSITFGRYMTYSSLCPPAGFL